MSHARILGFLAGAALCGMILGCTSSERPRRTTDVSSNDVQTETREAWEAVKDYTFEKKEDFLRRAESSLNRLDRHIDDFKARASDVSADSRDAWENALADLRREREDLRQSFQRVRDASREAWDEVKTAFRQAMDDLDRAFDRATNVR